MSSQLSIIVDCWLIDYKIFGFSGLVSPGWEQHPGGEFSVLDGRVRADNRSAVDIRYGLDFLQDGSRHSMLSWTCVAWHTLWNE
jgi:hypothetical protein